MEYIRNKTALERALETAGIPAYFETEGLNFRLVSFEKGELLSSPVRPLRDLLFVLEGTVQVYLLREDGSSILISRGLGQTVLGTVEFARRGLPALFTEATSDLLCVALPLEENRAALEADRVFLRFVLARLTDMVLSYTLIGQPQQTVEEKLMVFLRYIKPDHTLHGMAEGIAQLHCSRRQLQRAVRGLCGRGKLERSGRGIYVAKGK